MFLEPSCGVNPLSMDWDRDRLLRQGFFSSKCEILSTREMISEAKRETQRRETKIERERVSEIGKGHVSNRD